MDLLTPKSSKHVKHSPVPSDDSPIVCMSKEEMDLERKQAASFTFSSSISNVGSVVNYQQNIEQFSGNVQLSGDVCMVAPNPGNRAAAPRAPRSHEYIAVPKKMMDEGKPIDLLTGRGQSQTNGNTGTIPTHVLIKHLRGANWFKGNAPWYDARLEKCAFLLRRSEITVPTGDGVA